MAYSARVSRSYCGVTSMLPAGMTGEAGKKAPEKPPVKPPVQPPVQPPFSQPPCLAFLFAQKKVLAALAALAMRCASAQAFEASPATYREQQEEPTLAGARWLVLQAPASRRSTLLHSFSKLGAPPTYHGPWTMHLVSQSVVLACRCSPLRMDKALHSVHSACARANACVQRREQRLGPTARATLPLALAYRFQALFTVASQFQGVAPSPPCKFQGVALMQAPRDRRTPPRPQPCALEA